MKRLLTFTFATYVMLAQANWFTVNPPDFSTFTWLNQNTASYAVVNGLPVITTPYQSGTTQWNNLLKPLPASNYTATLVLAPSSTSYGIWHYGLSLQNGTTTKAVNMMVNHYTAPAQIVIYQESSSTIYAGSETAVATFNLPVAQIRALRVVEDGTHRTYYYSADGGTAWAQLYQEPAGTYLTPTKFGISMANIQPGLTAHATVYRLEATNP